MTDLRALIYIEIDINYCANTYGSAPCTAALTGDAKCFNTRNRSSDCQDVANFTPGTKTLRFGLHDRPLPPDIHCIPLLSDASVTNARVKPGESIGERASLTATFINSRHGDAGIDKYIVDRTYNPFDQGTFWGKFRARNPYLEARPIRIYRGYYGEALAEMDCEHFIIEKMQGPDNSGRVTISGVDFMALLNSDKALAPAPNSGYINADASVGATALTLLPTGIGDLEYPASGTGVLGKEVITFTRTGDAVTCSALVEDHDEGETLQIPLEYEAQNAAVIIDDLVTNFSELGAGYTDLAAWEAIVTSFADVLYSRFIPKPTPVRKLINELVEQAGLVIFGNTRTQQIVFDVLRPNPSTGTPIGPDDLLLGSFSQVDQPDKRFSAVVVYYGKRDPFESNEPTNFYSAVLYPVADNQYLTPSIKTIYSEWIPSTGRSVATDVAARAVARYQFPPLRLRFSLFANKSRQLGQVVQLTDPSVETATGGQGSLQAIITGWAASTEANEYEAEEYNIDANAFAGDKIIQVDYDTFNITLRGMYDALYGTVDESPGAPDIIFIITPNAKVGSTSSSGWAIESGDWPAGVEPLLEIRAGDTYVVGKGGDAGVGPNAGSPGGGALRVTSPIRVNNLGTIGGGGGGGGGTVFTFEGFILGLWPGGGGAGALPGSGVPAGTLTTGSTSGFNGASGGDLGQPGTAGTAIAGTHYPGGAAGAAVEGDSLITWINEGTILGARSG